MLASAFRAGDYQLTLLRPGAGDWLVPALFILNMVPWETFLEFVLLQVRGRVQGGHGRWPLHSRAETHSWVCGHNSLLPRETTPARSRLTPSGFHQLVSVSPMGVAASVQRKRPARCWHLQ